GEVAARWRNAIGADNPSTASKTATLTYSSTEDGIPGNVVEVVRFTDLTSGPGDPTGAVEYPRSVKREFDEAELVVANKINQRRDWNGFVREMRGQELKRLRTLALERRLLIFGPTGEKGMPWPSVSLSDDGKSYLLHFAGPRTLPVTWTVDRQ